VEYRWPAAKNYYIYINVSSFIILMKKRRKEFEEQDFY